MPIQHISDKMLRVMRRGFGRDRTIELLNYMKSKPMPLLGVPLSLVIQRREMQILRRFVTF